MGFIQIPHLSVSLTFINWIPQNNCTEEESEWLAWKREVRERGGGRGGEVIQIKELQSISVPLFGLTSMKTLVDYTIYYVTLDWDQSLPNQALRKIWIGSMGRIPNIPILACSASVVTFLTKWSCFVYIDIGSFNSIFSMFLLLFKSYVSSRSAELFWTYFDIKTFYSSLIFN